MKYAPFFIGFLLIGLYTKAAWQLADLRKEHGLCLQLLDPSVSAVAE